jgi:hypothetical protein
MKCCIQPQRRLCHHCGFALVSTHRKTIPKIGFCKKAKGMSSAQPQMAPLPGRWWGGAGREKGIPYEAMRDSRPAADLLGWSSRLAANASAGGEAAQVPGGDRGAVLPGGFRADAGRARIVIIRYPIQESRPPWPASTGMVRPPENLLICASLFVW